MTLASLVQHIYLFFHTLDLIKCLLRLSEMSAILVDLGSKVALSLVGFKVNIWLFNVSLGILTRLDFGV